MKLLSAFLLTFITLCLLANPTPPFGNSCVSQASGNWNAAGTWTSCGGSVPGIGDTANVAAGHSVTVTANATVGTSGDGSSNDVVVNGTLTISNSIQLTVRGSMASSGTGADITLGSGSILEFDASHAASPSTTNYILNIASTNNPIGDNAPKLVANGTSGSHAIIRSNSGGGNAYLTGNTANDGGRNFLTYTEVTRMGTTTQPSSKTWCSFATDCIKWSHVWLTNSSGIDSTTHNTTTQQFDYVTARSMISGGPGMAIKATTGTTADRHIKNSIFTGAVSYTALNMTVDATAFLNGWFPISSFGNATSIQNSLIRFASADNIGQNVLARMGPWTNNLVMNDCSTWNDANGTYSAKTQCANPHWTTPSGGDSSVVLYSVTQTVFDDVASDGTGDIEPAGAFKTSGPTGYTHMTYSLAIPGDKIDGSFQGSPGVLTHNNQTATDGSIYEHNTWFGGNQSMLGMYEDGSAGTAGQVSSFQSNIVWTIPHYLNGNTYSAGPGGANPGCNFNWLVNYPNGTLCAAPSGSVANPITTADYNASWNVFRGGLASPFNGNGYAIRGSGYGTHDVLNVDPAFVDTTREFATWVQNSLGSSPGGTPDSKDYRAWGLYLISLMNNPNDPNYNSNATIANALTWIKAGYAPTATAYHNTAHDGTDIGAIPWGGTIAISPTSISKTCTLGGPNPSSTTETITATLTLDNWTATKSASWLTLTPTSGTVASTFVASINCTGLTAGSLSDTISVASTTTGVTNSPQTVSVSLTVSATLSITTTSLPNGANGIPYSQTLAKTGGASPFTWTVISGSLCSGLSLSSSGVISGTPNLPQACSFTVRVTDGNSAAASQPLSILIVDPPRGSRSSTASVSGVSK